MIRRNVILNAKLVEQRTLRHLPRPHHRQTSLASRQVNQPITPRSSGVFQHNQPKADQAYFKFAPIPASFFALDSGIR